jgi:hypothetical protein
MMGLGETLCPRGQVADAQAPGGCAVIFASEELRACPSGQHTDPISFKCVPNGPLQASMGPMGWGAILCGALVGLAAIMDFARQPTAGARRRRG